MRKYEAVIFDLDGTLLDTLEDLKDAVNYVMRKHDFPEHSLESIRKAVGNGIRKLMERSVPKETTKEKFEVVFSDFCIYYKDNCKKKTKPYEGVAALVKKLREEGYKLAVVSNKNDEAVKEIIPYYFGEMFDVTVGAKEEIAKKPAPDMTLYALEQLGVAKENAVYIGDSQVDVKTAENVGMEGIFVTWGFRDREELKEAGAKEFADDAIQLYDKIRKESGTFV
ncbi:MAG: HAD-IIIA family hydrolase [Lachnospiraceae bacterium]|nr:HAD-IIIA family hydrolase [Lachnospiraceae bacterium]